MHRIRKISDRAKNMILKLSAGSSEKAANRRNSCSDDKTFLDKSLSSEVDGVFRAVNEIEEQPGSCAKKELRSSSVDDSKGVLDHEQDQEEESDGHLQSTIVKSCEFEGVAKLDDEKCQKEAFEEGCNSQVLKCSDSRKTVSKKETGCEVTVEQKTAISSAQDTKDEARGFNGESADSSQKTAEMDESVGRDVAHSNSGFLDAFYPQENGDSSVDKISPSGSEDVVEEQVILFVNKETGSASEPSECEAVAVEETAVCPSQTSDEVGSCCDKKGTTSDES